MARSGKFRTIIPIGNKRYYAVRNPDGTFADIQKIGRAHGQDFRRQAKGKSKPGRGWTGDR